MSFNYVLVVNIIVEYVTAAAAAALGRVSVGLTPRRSMRIADYLTVRA